MSWGGGSSSPVTPIIPITTDLTDKNCSDFSTHSAAQAYYLQHPGSDLDRDQDGIACESLPGAPARDGVTSWKNFKRVDIVDNLVWENKKTAAERSIQSFSDLNINHWAYNPISALAQRSLILGYPNGTYQPEETLTYIQALTILQRMFSQISLENRSKSDATRAEIASLLYEILEVDESIKNHDIMFSDIESKHPHYHSIISLARLGIFNGFEDGTFRPAETVTRGQFAALLYRIIENDFIPSIQIGTFSFQTDHAYKVAFIRGESNIEITQPVLLVQGFIEGKWSPIKGVSANPDSELSFYTLNFPELYSFEKIALVVYDPLYERWSASSVFVLESEISLMHIYETYAKKLSDLDIEYNSLIMNLETQLQSLSVNDDLADFYLERQEYYQRKVNDLTEQINEFQEKDNITWEEQYEMKIFQDNLSIEQEMLSYYTEYINDVLEYKSMQETLTQVKINYEVKKIEAEVEFTETIEAFNKSVLSN